jgi:competence ComEA-like helix-hairpin-helix protein
MYVAQVLRTTTLLLVVGVLVTPLQISAETALININTADASKLDTLPGIGPSKAAAIVTYRTQHGPFSHTEDIQKVTGIGPVTYAKFEQLITVDTSPIEPTTTTPVQPSSSATSLDTRQPEKQVAPITSPTSNVPPHVDAVLAPAAATDLASAGASLPTSRASGSGVFGSLWTFGFIGVILIASGAFIFL